MPGRLPSAAESGGEESVGGAAGSGERWRYWAVSEFERDSDGPGMITELVVKRSLADSPPDLDDAGRER